MCMHEGVTTTLIVIGQGDKPTFIAISLSAELCDTCLATVSIDESTVVTKNARRHGHTPKIPLYAVGGWKTWGERIRVRLQRTPGK